MDATFETLKKELPRVQRKVLLKKYTTFNIGGPAEYFLLAQSKEEILRAVRVTKHLKLPIFVMGGGSNLLVSDKGVKGLVIKLSGNGNVTVRGNILSAPAGVELKKLVDISIQHSLKGLEWAGGLPGTFGGAIRGNAGAFGGEIKDSIFQVQALDHNFKVKNFSNQQCHFAYRNSIFKQKSLVVIFAAVKLQRGNKSELRRVSNSRIHYRKERHPLEYPNAGSIFKNMEFKKFPKKFQKILRPVVKQDPFKVVPTAYIISEAGLKGKTMGKAQISPKHPNFMVNLGGAKASDVIKLIAVVKKAIKKKYGIHLETEVQIIGEK